MQNVYWLTKFNTTKLRGFEPKKMSRLFDDKEKQIIYRSSDFSVWN